MWDQLWEEIGNVKFVEEDLQSEDKVFEDLSEVQREAEAFLLWRY